MWVTGLAEDGQGGDFGKEGLQRLHEFLAAAWTVVARHSCPEPKWSVVGRVGCDRWGDGHAVFRQALQRRHEVGIEG